MSSHGSAPTSRHILRALLPVRYFSQSSPRALEHLPPIAPRPSINIKHIRQNPESYSRNCLERNYKAQSEHPFKIVKLFDQWRQSQIDTRSLREKSNAIQSQLSRGKKSSGLKQSSQDTPRRSRKDLIEEARKQKHELSTTEIHEAQLTSEIETLAAELPNLTSVDTPRQEPRVVGYINKGLKPDGMSLKNPYHRKFFSDHAGIGVELDIFDFSGAATTSGWGWYYLKNEAALLEQALVQYALSVAMKHGFTVVTPPSMVYSHIASACGFRPRDQSGEQQVYDIQQSERDLGRDKPTHSLAGTAEIPFAGMKANGILEFTELPLKVVGSSRCYRAEAGARGADTKGLYRVHEFTKVEMFAWTVPGGEVDVFDGMIKVQTEILKGLGLHCRILEMPSSDLGASAVRKQDIEVYFPSRSSQDEGWGEVTSTSICTDYQTRRLNTRVKMPLESEVKMGYPSTVNGTAMAIPRVLAALLEYHCHDNPLTGIRKRHQQLFVRIPQVLWPWMHGLQTIKKLKPQRGKLEQDLGPVKA